MRQQRTKWVRGCYQEVLIDNPVEIVTDSLVEEGIEE